MDLSNELQDAIQIAKGAGKIILEFYETDFSHKTKSDNSPVTEADIASDSFIRRELAKKYSYPILSEETKDDLARLKSDYLWLVDPLDGTKDFIERTGTFGVLIGLVYKSKPVCGVIYRPTIQTSYLAEKGKGAYKQKDGQTPDEIHVSGESSLINAKFIVSSHNPEAAQFIKERIGTKNIERMGGFAGKIIAVATGEFDACVNPATGKGGEWDECAPDIILEEAGGIITDLLGNRFTYNNEKFSENGYVVSNRELHDQIIEKIAPYV